MVLIESRGPVTDGRQSAVYVVTGRRTFRRRTEDFTVECETVDDVLSVRRQADAAGFMTDTRRNEPVVEFPAASLVRPYVLIAYDVT